MKIPRPSHATVVAYVALFVAIGGSAYAVSKIGSPEIRNRSIRGKDVANATLGPRPIAEERLSGPVAVGDERSPSCDPLPGVPVDCVGQTIKLHRDNALLVIATASKGAQTGSGVCAMTVDGTESNGAALGGMQSDGFAVTKVTPILDRGRHTVALRCTEANPNFTLDNPTIAAVAVRGET